MTRGAQFHNGHGLAELGGNCGKLQADEPATDDDEAGRRVDAFTQPVGIGEPTDGEDAVELGARHRQRTIADAERQRQMIVAQTTSRLQLDLAGRPVDGRDRFAENELDVAVLIEFLAAEKEPVGADGADQISLRQGRPLIGQISFFADQNDAPGEAKLAQRGGELHARMAGTNDDLGFFGHFEHSFRRCFWRTVWRSATMPFSSRLR